MQIFTILTLSYWAPCQISLRTFKCPAPAADHSAVAPSMVYPSNLTVPVTSRSKSFLFVLFPSGSARDPGPNFAMRVETVFSCPFLAAITMGGHSCPSSSLTGEASNSS